MNQVVATNDTNVVSDEQISLESDVEKCTNSKRDLALKVSSGKKNIRARSPSPTVVPVTPKTESLGITDLIEEEHSKHLIV